MGPEAVYVTILRDPSEAFESLYDYYGLSNFFNKSARFFIEK